jgi:hypothetical protein
MKTLDSAITVCIALAAMARVEGGARGAEDSSAQITATVKTARYEVRGDREGRVVVRNATSGKTVTTFTARPGVIRRVFLLDGGDTVVVSQKDQTLFWDLAANRERRRIDEQIYGFNHAEDKFLTFSAKKGAGLSEYPTLDRICSLKPAPSVGPESFRFSPDDRYLAILFASGRPESDESFPHPDPVRRGVRYSRLFDLRNCREIDAFTTLDAKCLGEFSKDSQVYELPDCTLKVDGKVATGSWLFDLRSARLSLAR